MLLRAPDSQGRATGFNMEQASCLELLDTRETTNERAMEVVEVE